MIDIDLKEVKGIIKIMMIEEFGSVDTGKSCII